MISRSVKMMRVPAAARPTDHQRAVPATM